MRTLISLLVLLALSFRSHAAEEGDTTYHNPVDGRDYTAKWKTYTAEPKGTPAPEGKIRMGTIRLLAEQTLIERNITAKAIAGFIVAVRDRITAVVPRNAHKFELFVQVTLTAQSAKVRNVLSRRPTKETVAGHLRQSFKDAQPSFQKGCSAVPDKLRHP